MPKKTPIDELIDNCECVFCRLGEAGGQHEMARIVQEHGLAVVPIIDTKPQLTFSIGLFHSYRHPELITYGLPARGAHLIFNDVAKHIKEKGAVKTGEPISGLANMPMVFRKVDPFFVKQEMGSCVRFYQGRVPPALQLVWPDPAGHFPWDKDWNTKFDKLQPRLWLEVH